MGAKRKVDEKLYAKIKKELKTPKDDKKVMKKYKLGQTIVRAVRNSWCYDDYVSRTKRKKITINSLSSQRQAQMAWTGFMGLLFVGMFIVLTLFIRWILSWFGI